MDGNHAVTNLPPAKRKQAMGLLFGVLLLLMMGFSVLFPVEPYYVTKFGITPRNMGLIAATYSLMQFLFSPLWGRLSDRIGRRPVLMLGLSGYIVGQTLWGISTSAWMLFAARTLAGMISAAALPTAMAYIADITSGEERAKGMGLVGAAFGLGVIVGPGVGGSLGKISLALPFFVSAGLAACALIAVFSLLPESLPEAARTRKAAPRKSRWSAFIWEIAALYGVTLVLSTGMAGIEQTFGFFAQRRLALQPHQVSWIFVIMGVVASFVQGFLVGKLQKRLGESRMSIIGLLLGAVGMATVAFSSSVVLAAVGICIIAAGVGMARPANSALISRRASTGQGQAIGLLDAFDSLGRIAGPALGGALFDINAVLPYISGGALFVVALALAAAWAARAGLLKGRGEVATDG